MRIPLNTDFAAAAVGFVFAAVMWFGSELPGRLSIIFPRAVLVILCLLCAGLVIKGFLRPSGHEVVIEGSPARLVSMIAALLIWWLGIRYIGFIVATAIVFIAVTSYLAYVNDMLTWQRFLTWLPIIAAIIGTFYLAFTYILSVDLPSGVLI